MRSAREAGARSDITRFSRGIEATSPTCRLLAPLSTSRRIDRYRRRPTGSCLGHAKAHLARCQIGDENDFTADKFLWRAVTGADAGKNLTFADLRIGKVLQCGLWNGSDKLLRFELDAGELGKRQIFSGIRAGYGAPEKLVGRKVVFIANLAPRKLRFGMSEGMILSAGGDNGLFLLDVDSGAEAACR